MIRGRASEGQAGYRYEPDKFDVPGFTPMESLCVKPPRVAECPVQMEGMVHEFRSFGQECECKYIRSAYCEAPRRQELLVGDETRPHIDPVRWRPLTMNFCRFFGLTGDLHPSR